MEGLSHRHTKASWGITLIALVLDSCHCLLSSSFEIDMNRFKKKKKKVIGYRIFIIMQAVNDSYQ